MANSTFDVQGYVDDEALPILVNKLGITRTLDRKYENWEKPESYGTRGDTFLCKLPTRINANDGLTFQTQEGSTDGDFAERVLAVVAGEQANARYAITDVQQAVFDVDGLLKSNPIASLNELAIKMDTFSATSVSFRGYRAFGDFAISPNQNTTVAEVTDNVATFQSFGCGSMGYYANPFRVSAKIVQSGLQQFVLKRNEDLAVKGELGELGGVPETTFLTTNLLPVHTAGTAADDAGNLTPGFTIDSVVVTPPTNDLSSGTQAGTTTINLSGMTNGLTILKDDMIDIGKLNIADPLFYLTFTGYIPSEQLLQGRVTANVTVAGGVVAVVVEPAMIFDGANLNVNRNLSRDIIPGTDTLRVAKSHRCGALYLGEYGKFVSPPLPQKEPYPTGTKMSPEMQLSVRAYYGANALGGQTKYFVQDVIYGFGGGAEGFARVLLSP